MPIGAVRPRVHGPAGGVVPRRGAGVSSPPLAERLRRVASGSVGERPVVPATAPRRSALLAPFVLGVLVGVGLMTTLWFNLPRGGAPTPTRRAEAPAVPNAAGGTMPVWTVCFTPGGACTDLLVTTLAGARREVLVQAYSFTSPPVAEALEAAQRRGVRVRVILDDSQLSERYSVADGLRAHGVEVWIDDPSGIAHNKVMVVDGQAVVTGSFNFSRSAQSRNAENLLVLRDAAIAARYAENWERRRAASQIFEAASRPAAANDDEPETPKRPARHGLF